MGRQLFMLPPRENAIQIFPGLFLLKSQNCTSLLRLGLPEQGGGKDPSTAKAHMPILNACFCDDVYCIYNALLKDQCQNHH